MFIPSSTFAFVMMAVYILGIVTTPILFYIIVNAPAKMHAAAKRIRDTE